jgi:hypothetical protein
MPLFAAALLAASAAAAPAAAQGARTQSIRISATIAPAQGLSADALTPRLLLAGSGAGHPGRPVVVSMRSPAGVAGVSPLMGAAAAAVRYRVVVRLADDDSLAQGLGLTLVDADGRERALAPGAAVVIARGATAAEASAALVRLRARGRASDAGAVLPLVYEVTSESALAM